MHRRAGAGDEEAKGEQDQEAQRLVVDALARGDVRNPYR